MKPENARIRGRTRPHRKKALGPFAQAQAGASPIARRDIHVVGRTHIYTLRPSLPRIHRLAVSRDKLDCPCARAFTDGSCPPTPSPRTKAARVLSLAIAGVLLLSSRTAFSHRPPNVPRPLDVIANGLRTQPAIGRVTVVGIVQTVFVARPTASSAQAGPREPPPRRERRRAVRCRGRRLATCCHHRRRLGTVAAGRRAGPIRTVRRVHAVGVRRDTNATASAAAAIAAVVVHVDTAAVGRTVSHELVAASSGVCHQPSTAAVAALTTAASVATVRVDRVLRRQQQAR